MASKLSGCNELHVKAKHGRKQHQYYFVNTWTYRVAGITVNAHHTNFSDTAILYHIPIRVFLSKSRSSHPAALIPRYVKYPQIVANSVDYEKCLSPNLQAYLSEPSPVFV